MQFEPYLEQSALWPSSGRHILAGFDEQSIVVYGAYSERIGHFAVQNGRFGGDFSFSRMSWIKPNFLWMMFRCGWATKENQTCVLAIRIRRALWDEILSLGVPSSFDAGQFVSVEDWKRELARGEVRLQWDPDHLPRGQKVARRAVQLGLRGEILRRFATQALSIEDVSEFVRAQKTVVDGDDWSAVLTPRERVYVVKDAQTAKRLGLEVLDTERAAKKSGL